MINKLNLLKARQSPNHQSKEIKPVKRLESRRQERKLNNFLNSSKLNLIKKSELSCWNWNRKITKFKPFYKITKIKKIVQLRNTRIE